MSRLPVADCLDAIVQHVKLSTPVVLKAPPGAGKTTGVPPTLLDPQISGPGEVLLIQPRRMAARAAARRLAQLDSSPLGQRIGYHVRFDRRCSSETKLIAMTNGMLLRRLHDDPLLESVSCVVLDEFHERSVETDLALGMLHRIRTTFRPELKVVVMSATLDPDPIVCFLDDAVGITSEGRSFPVHVNYAREVSQTPVDRQVAEILPEALSETTGDVLVFLPGVGEIRRAHRTLQAMRLPSDPRVLELYGDLPPKQQDAVLKPSNERRVILATNVAETSVTIDGVTAVIDSGLARVMGFDAVVGLPRLRLESISQASADQRAGRAGRTQPGTCWRLWPEAMHRSRRERDLPEIQRGDLSSAVLMLAGWGERDVMSFPWLTAPPLSLVEAARSLLQQLDAIDEQLHLTPMGKRMLALPLHPRLARFMLEAERWHVSEEAAVVAAMLGNRDPFRRKSTIGGVSTSASHAPGCDITVRMRAIQQAMEGGEASAVNPAELEAIRKSARQIQRLVPREDSSERLPNDEISVRIRRALLAAYPDRLARRREHDSEAGRMVGGRGVRLAVSSIARAGEFFLCIDVDGKGSEAIVRLACPIEPEWLETDHIVQRVEPFFDAQRQSVLARRRRYFQDLVLSEVPVACEPTAETAAILVEEASRDLTRIWPEKSERLDAFLGRVRFVSQRVPDADVPVIDEASIHAVLEQLCQSRTSFKELRSAPWLDHFRGLFRWDQLQTLEQLAPERIELPSGNSTAVRYEDDKPPAIEVRIQELFGWKETPRIGGGKVPLQLHLLGPNHRPQQITDDLAGFWQGSYTQVRKDLRGRYPKHHWPEDPGAAQATRNGLKPRR